MIGFLIRLVLGRYCPTHDTWYRSDFCPEHNRAMWVRFETREIVRTSLKGVSS